MNKDFDHNIRQINGPINVVRLEGEIHGIKKVIYLFMDYHIPLPIQTECTNVYSKDANKYLSESFFELNNASKKYDFFMEIRPTEIMDRGKLKEQKNIYIKQIAKLFSMIFIYDKEHNKVNISDYFKNIRLHYLDVRDYLKLHIYDYINSASFNASEMVYNGLNPDVLNDIIDALKQGKEHLDTTIEILMNPKYEIANKTSVISDIPYRELNPEIVARLSNKMISLYNHNDVKEVLNSKYFNLINDLKKLSNDINDSITIFNEYATTIINSYGKMIKDQYLNSWHRGLTGIVLRNMSVDVSNRCDKIFFELVNLFAYLTDIYFMRRFLDKDYVTNAIVYTGATHSENYINLLVGHFDFNITHVAYSSIDDMDALTKETITRINNKEDIYDLFNPEKVYQCSDITHFPKNFE